MNEATPWRSWLQTLTAAFLILAGVAPAQAAQRLLLPGHVPALISGLPALGTLDPARQLNLAINLPLHNQAELSAFLDQLSDPQSPEYHHYLTPDQFDARFGPTESDYESVVSWALRNGFTITGRQPNRMILEVSAPVAQIESALNVTLRTYTHPTEKRTFFAPDTEPSLDAALPISFINGLNNVSHPHPKNLVRRPLSPSPDQATPKMGSGPNGNLAGFDYRAAYAPGITLTGTGQQVGLLEFDGYYAGDVPQYESLTGVPNVPVQTVLLDGFTGTPGTANGEVALDIEMAISMAPGLSKVVVFESDTNGFAENMLNAMTTNTAIKQFSCSWSFGSLTSAQQTAMNNFFQKFIAQGQSFFDASGDSGSATGSFSPPDDNPYVTEVGGTTLATAGPGGAWLSEVSWNTGTGPGYGQSGGGVSSTYAIPAWQKGVNMTTNKGSTTFRNSPDVAMVADDIFIVADNGTEETTGGTSAASPLWAGFTALINQRAAALSASSVGFINPAIYHIGTNSGFTACFDDVTSGNNTNASVNQYPAVIGYDLCTGFGSASGGSLIIALTQPDGFQITPGRGAVASGPQAGPFSVTNSTMTLTNTGSTAFSWTAGSSASWLTVSATSGTLAAAGKASVTLTLNSVANTLPAGVYTANVWFTNLTSGLGQVRQFTVQVSQELVQDGGFESFDFCYWNLSGDDAVYTNNFVDYNGGYTGDSSYAGNCFAAMGQLGNLAYLSQPIPTRPGQYYLLSYWIENPNGATPNQFQVQWNATTNTTSIIFNQLNLGAITTYSNMVFVVQATTTNTILKFGVRNDNDFTLLDGVSVMPVPAPNLQTIASRNGSVTLTWSAMPGASYQVQYESSLAANAWVNLGSPITATANPMTVSETVSAGSPRFFRVEFVP